MGVARPIQVQFPDGQLSCVGWLAAGAETELEGVDEEGVWETTDEVLLNIEAEGELTTDDGISTPLRPGLYVINSNGLFLRIDGTASPAQ